MCPAPLLSLPHPPSRQAFLEGFWQLVPRELIAIFNDHELELLISGLPDIDVADLRANTQYSGYSPASPVIQWFWQVVAEMEKQDLALLLQFVTGGDACREDAAAGWRHGGGSQQVSLRCMLLPGAGSYEGALHGQRVVLLTSSSAVSRQPKCSCVKRLPLLSVFACAAWRVCVPPQVPARCR